MTIEINNVQRLRVRAESSFAADMTATMASFTDVPFIEGSMQFVLPEEMLDPKYAQQHKDGYPTQLVGQRRGVTLSFTQNLASTGTAAANGVTAVQSALGLILANVMGEQALVIGSAVATASSASVFTYDNSASKLAGGYGAAVGWVNAAGDMEVVPVQGLASGTFTGKFGFSAAPQASDVLYASASYALGQDPTGSLQFAAEGFELQDRWLLRGGQLSSMTLNLPIGQLPTITFNFQFADWLEGDLCTTNLSSTALAIASYTNVSPSHVEGGLYIQTVGTNTRPTATAASSITITPAIAYIAQTSPSGTNSIARWVRNRVAPVVSGSFVVPYQDQSEWFDVRTAKTQKIIFLQSGTAAGKTVCVEVPTAQITNVTRSQEDITSQTVEFKGGLDADVNGTDTDFTLSAFRLHFL